jgi:hypothetical protein
VRSTAAPYTESRLTHLVRNKCVGFPVVEQVYTEIRFVWVRAKFISGTLVEDKNAHKICIRETGEWYGFYMTNTILNFFDFVKYWPRLVKDYLIRRPDIAQCA